MAMAQVIDYSAGYPGGAAVRDAGFEGVIRYLRKEGTSSVRPITAGEFADMRAHGRTVALVYQHVTKSRPTQGRAAGRHDAQWAHARARDIGVDPRCIYFAVDFDTTSVQQWAAIREYMLGAGEVLGVERVGTYGEYDLLDYLFTRGSITWGWQTYAWSTGHNKDNQPRHPRAHLFQRLGQITVGGISCDVNDVLKADYGQEGGDMAGEIADAQIGKVPSITGSQIGRPNLEAAYLWTDIYGWGARANAALGRVEAQLAALAGTLADDEANIIAAVRQIVADDTDTEVVLGPEQYEQLLAALPPVVADGLREAFTRAGQETP